MKGPVFHITMDDGSVRGTMQVERTATEFVTRIELRIPEMRDSEAVFNHLQGDLRAMGFKLRTE